MKPLRDILSIFVILSVITLTGCVEREIPLYERACSRDAQCEGGQFCNAGVCADKASRAPRPDVGIDIEGDLLRAQTLDISSPLDPPGPEPVPIDLPGP